MHPYTSVSIAAGKNIPQLKTTIGFKQRNPLIPALLNTITNYLVAWFEHCRHQKAHHFLSIESTLLCFADNLALIALRKNFVKVVNVVILIKQK